MSGPNYQPLAQDEPQPALYPNVQPPVNIQSFNKSPSETQHLVQGQQPPLPQEGYSLYPPTATPIYVYDPNIPQQPKLEFQTIDSVHVREYLLNREFELDTGKYIKLAWQKYKEFWWGYTGIFILFLLIYYIPYVGPLIAWPLTLSCFIATANSLRTGQPIVARDFFQGYVYYLPLFLLGLMAGFIIMFGLILFILPGIWLAISLAWASFLFLEYHQCGISICDCLTISFKVVNKNFCSVFVYSVLLFLFVLSGLLMLGIGIFVTIPIASIAAVFAFDDIFGINRGKAIQTLCVTNIC